MTGYILFLYLLLGGAVPTMVTATFETQAACMAAGNELVDAAVAEQRYRSVWFRCISDGKVR